MTITKRTAIAIGTISKTSCRPASIGASNELGLFCGRAAHILPFSVWGCLWSEGLRGLGVCRARRLGFRGLGFRV